MTPWCSQAKGSYVSAEQTAAIFLYMISASERRARTRPFRKLCKEVLQQNEKETQEIIWHELPKKGKVNGIWT